MIIYSISSNLCKENSLQWLYTFRLSVAATGGCSVRRCVLRYFAKFTGKHLWQSLFSMKLLADATASDLSRVFS